MVVADTALVDPHDRAANRAGRVEIRMRAPRVMQSVPCAGN
ncbi:hypothetical protein ACFQ2B_33180 [Streptomyces stramineus]|uniref:Transposase n=1 Tax=Streptomyces stramineus TaxID=173861 RepID=A0ABP3K5V2_9ACTN